MPGNNKELIILDNVILPTQADFIESSMISVKTNKLSKIAWYFGDSVVDLKCEEEDTPKKYQYMFVHQFFDPNWGIVTNPENWNLIQPLREKLNAGSYLRVKANLYPALLSKALPNISFTSFALLLYTVSIFLIKSAFALFNTVRCCPPFSLYFIAFFIP